MLWCLVPAGASLSIVLLYVTMSQESCIHFEYLEIFFLKPQVWAGGLLDQAGLAQGVVWLHITDMCASGRVG